MSDVYQSINDDPKTKCPKCKDNKLRLVISGGMYFSTGANNIRKPDHDTATTQETPEPTRKKQWYDDSGSATKSEIAKMTNKQKRDYIMRGEK